MGKSILDPGNIHTKMEGKSTSVWCVEKPGWCGWRGEKAARGGGWEGASVERAVGVLRRALAFT